MLLESVVFFYFHLSGTLPEGSTLYVASRVGSYCQALRHDITFAFQANTFQHRSH